MGFLDGIPPEKDQAIRAIREVIRRDCQGALKPDTPRGDIVLTLILSASSITRINGPSFHEWWEGPISH